MRIGIIGAGWYGCHVARVLRRQGHEVVIFERNREIFSGISGSFGIRLHRGPHYPRSEETRKGCQRGFDKFHKNYPDLIVRHGHSIYALGEKDAAGQPPKVTREQFEAVCRETKDCRQILPRDSDWHYNNLLTAMDIKEPSILLGKRLRTIFETLLEEEQIAVKCNFEVKRLENCGDSVIVSNGEETEVFDYVVNATSYHNLLPADGSLPFEMKIVYQPCLALVYEDKKSTPLPFSFITLDGWFPCMMPFVQDDPMKESQEGHRRYILTHGKWTILGSRESHAEAQALLDNIDDKYINEKVKPNCEEALNSIWPDFTVEDADNCDDIDKGKHAKDEKRFKYLKWQSAILAKVVTNREFRSAITFEKDRIIYIIPGKVSNIFDVAKEVKALVGIKKAEVLNKNGYRYVQNGVLDAGTHEIIEPIKAPDRNTCMLQTFDELKERDDKPEARIKDDEGIAGLGTANTLAAETAEVTELDAPSASTSNPHKNAEANVETSKPCTLFFSRSNKEKGEDKLKGDVRSHAVKEEQAPNESGQRRLACG